MLNVPRGTLLAFARLYSLPSVTSVPRGTLFYLAQNVWSVPRGTHAQKSGIAFTDASELFWRANLFQEKTWELISTGIFNPFFVTNQV